MSADTCSYVFPEDHDEREEGMSWDCPHEAHPDHDRCVFHMPFTDRAERGVTPEDVRQELLAKANMEGERVKQFVGARFRRLDVSYTIINTADNYPLDLRYCFIEGRCDLSHADFIQPVTFEGCRIDGRFQANNVQFEGFCNFRDSGFNAFVSFDDTSFDGPALFDKSRFQGAGTDEDYPEFVASFQGTVFRDRCSFEDAVFKGRADFRDTTMMHANFHGASIDVFFLTRSDINSIFFTGVQPVNGDAYVSFVNSELHNGTLNQPYIMTDGQVVYPDESIYYNLEDAEIGDVKLKPDEHDVLFPYIYIAETTFNGFDFSNYTEYLYPDWDIHTYNGPLLQEGNIKSDLSWDYTTDPETCETTYIKARQAAETSGDTKAKSMFFINQMQQRRRRYRTDMREATKLPEKIRAGINVLGNHVMGTVAGHGERPWRVVGTSLMVIIICALLYPIGGIASQSMNGTATYAAADSTMDLFILLAESLYFSTTTFATLGFGDYYPGSFYAQIVAAVESIVGALLIALLVFVLGRRS